MFHDERAEVPFGEDQALQLRLGGDLRRTVGMVDDCHLSEVVTGAEVANGLPAHAHGRPSVHDDAEAYADPVHVGYHRASGKRELVRLPCELGDFLFRQHREQRDAGQDFLRRGHGQMLRPRRDHGSGLSARESPAPGDLGTPMSLTVITYCGESLEELRGVLTDGSPALLTHS